MVTANTDAYLPPLLLQTLEGVTKVPLFPKAGQGFNPAVVGLSRSRSEKLLQSRVYKIGTINRQKCPLEKLGEVP